MFSLDSILEEKKMSMSRSPSVAPSGILLVNAEFQVPAILKSHHARPYIRGAI